MKSTEADIANPFPKPAAQQISNQQLSRVQVPFGPLLDARLRLLTVTAYMVHALLYHDTSPLQNPASFHDARLEVLVSVGPRQVAVRPGPFFPATQGAVHLLPTPGVQFCQGDAPGCCLG